MPDLCNLCKNIDTITFAELQKLSCRCGCNCNSCGKWLRREPTGKVARCDACKEERQMSRRAISGMRADR